MKKRPPLAMGRPPSVYLRALLLSALPSFIDDRVNHDEHRAARDEQNRYLVQLLVDERLVAAEEVAEQRQYRDPDARAERRVEAELRQRHAREPRGQRDVLAYDGQQAAREGADVPVMREEDLGLVERLVRDEEIFSVLLKERPPPAHRYPVVEERAEYAAEYASAQDERYVHLALPREIARGRHDDLAREREERRFEEHQPDDARVAEMSYNVDEPAYESAEERGAVSEERKYCLQHESPFEFN